MITIQIQGLEELLGNILTRTVFGKQAWAKPANVAEVQTTEEPELTAETQEADKPKRGRGRPKKEETVAKEEAKEEPKTEEATEDLSDLSSSEAKPATPPEKPKSGKVSKEEAVRIGAGVMRSHGPAALKSILSTLGIERASALTDEQIPQFIEMCEMLE